MASGALQPLGWQYFAVMARHGPPALLGGSGGHPAGSASPTPEPLPGRFRSCEVENPSAGDARAQQSARAALDETDHHREVPVRPLRRKALVLYHILVCRFRLEHRAFSSPPVMWIDQHVAAQAATISHRRAAPRPRMEHPVLHRSAGVSSRQARCWLVTWPARRDRHLVGSFLGKGTAYSAQLPPVWAAPCFSL